MFKDIPGYDGIYQISKTGEVRSYSRGNIRILKQLKGSTGYLHVVLSYNGRCKTIKIHKIVATVFLQKIQGKNIINHKNGIKTDNRIENLEWCTYSENLKHAWDKGLNRGNGKKILQHSKDGSFIREWESMASISRELGIKHQNISRCCLGTKYCKTAGGFIWKFL